jgi:hypothetical protein
MDSFEQLIHAIRSCTPEQKQRIFSEIRDSILIHELERTFSVRAEIILEAISRASDLTQRGVRGVIAETVFVLDVLPTATGWLSEPPIGNVAYDALLQRNSQRVRIQVKTQRRSAGVPMIRGGSYVVEVQRTRGGVRAGVSTRPYRFGEFDLLAVCMWASTGDWHSFLYAPAARLVADPTDKAIIKKYQAVPNYTEGNGELWAKSLPIVLDRMLGENS